MITFPSPTHLDLAAHFKRKDMPTYAVVEKSMLSIFKKLVKKVSDEKVVE